jgi:hypothetical protein
VKTPSDPWQESLETWLIQSRNDALPEDHRAGLNALLRNSPEARAHATQFLLEDTLLSERLRQDRLESFFEQDSVSISALPDHPRTLRSRSATRLPWRALMPLAAGLVIGLFSAGVVFGYVGSGPLRAITLLHESFESAGRVQAKGAPLTPGNWSGDFSEVTGPAAGISPVHGTKMFRFLRADHLDKRSKAGFKGDVYRILDVREHATSFADGKAMITAEASFRSIPGINPAAYDAGIELHAIETLPSTPNQFFSPKTLPGTPRPSAEQESSEVRTPYFTPATAHRQIPLAPSNDGWQRVRVELRIPEGTRYVVVGLHIVDRLAGTQPPETRDVSFPGQFADDVQVRLIRKMPLP